MKKFKKIFNWGQYKVNKCIVGILLESLAVNLFIVPNNLYTGGILGLSQLIRTFIFNFVDINLPFDLSTIIYYLINIPLLVIAYKKISKTFFARTILTVTLNTLFLMIIPIPKEPLVPEIITNVMIGGLIAGVGLGMVLSTGSSSGGTDIIGIVISQKKRLLTVGNIGLGFNAFVYAICGVLGGISTMIYSIIYAVFESVLIDFNHSQNITSQAFIFTKESPDKIIDFIKDEIGRDATYWDAVGGYTKTKTYIIYTVLSKYEKMRLERHMDEFDKNAFMVGSDGASIHGEFEKHYLNT